ncbi:MAG TPA: exosortase [Oligoflexia bacterium]|nr:exosortase [Oligoflexia bacterium]
MGKITELRILLPLCLGIGLAVLFYPTLRDVAEICWNYEDYSHGLLLPFITGYLIWCRREEIAERLPVDNASAVGFSKLGAFLYAAGLIGYLLGRAGDSFFACWIFLFPTLIGVLLLLFGARLVAPIAGPLLINYMAKPVPDSLLPKLLNPFQTFAAAVSAKVLELFQVPVHAMGNVIEIPGMRLLVEQACSGMRSLISLITVALIVLALMELNWLGSVLILAIAVITAVILNIVRVALTGLLAYFVDPATATGFFHSFAGMVVFLLGLAILFFFGRQLEPRFRRIK